MDETHINKTSLESLVFKYAKGPEIKVQLCSFLLSEASLRIGLQHYFQLMARAFCRAPGKFFFAQKKNYEQKLCSP